jgi:RNA polymerase sigma-70 factor (ECF subfamily)
VLAVLWLLFNEGYAASGGEQLIRAQLCQEAIRLTRALVTLMPDEPEASGLLALMLLAHSRRRARVDRQGDVITLEDQDRARWDGPEIAEGLAVLRAALRRRAAGPYQLQAAIAACHAEAPDAEATDWEQIAALYGLLGTVMDTSVVHLNRAVAVAMAGDLDGGLAIVDRLDRSGELAQYHLLYATRADLLRRRGDREAARSAYAQALELAGSEPDRRFIGRRLRELG